MPVPPVRPEAYQEALRVAFAAAKSAADRNRARLMKDPNVVDVRAGYKFQGGWITDTPAVVVTVLRKDPPEALGDKLLPAELDGVPVDVAPATPVQQLRHRAARTRGGTRAAAGPLPGLPDEEPYLEPAGPPAGEEDTGTRAAGTGGRGYKEPKDLKLSAVSGAMTLTCHASPDAGWPNLQKFLAGTEKTLTVAMYDFGAKYIFAAIKEAVAAAPGPFVLNLDRRSNPDRKGEMTEQQIEDAFHEALGDKFQYSTAAVGVLYPNAYHIKVAVRDGKSVWLSSGNWQGSNQPDADAAKLSEAEQRKLLSERNREWHVIADAPKLARIFEEYIKFDVREAQRVRDLAVARGLTPVLPELLEPEEEVTRAVRQVKIFPAKKFTFTADNPVKVQPLLTPDNYGEHVLKLIRSATKTLYFQNQYIKIYQTFPDSGGKPGLKDLVDALLDRMHAGVDVKIILRNNDARPMLQALKTYGFDTARVKLLSGCHNKGIIVDSKAVVVSSQNYSADGARFNRDAGLIIFHPKVASYFEQIFLYDWKFRAYQQVPGEQGAMPLLPEVAAAAPAAGTRSARRGRTLSWDEYYQD